MRSINSPYLVQHFLEIAAKRLPNKDALICAEKHFTYKEINEDAERLASSLIDLGIQRQDRIAIFLDNSAESVIALFGILKAGAIFIMLSATMKSKKLNYILKDSGARVLITHSNKMGVVKEAISSLPDLKNILWVGRPSSSVNKKVTIGNFLWEEFLSSACDLFSKNYANRCIDVDLATIIYTSGSTGEPKGVMSAHFNVVAAARSITTYLKNIEDDIILNALPLSFDYGLYQVFMAFLFAGTLILEKSFVYPQKVMERLVKERATGFPIVPTMAAILFHMKNLSKFDFSYLRYITNTAAALPVAYIKKLQALLPNVKIYSMYGLTECKRVSYLPPGELSKRPNSVGIPIPNEEVFILNEAGQEAEAGAAGELVVRGSNVMQGYWNAPEETAKTFRSGGYRGETFLYSGDLFRKDEEGFLYFIARKDDLIKTKGERVSPKEIENTLCEIEGVLEAAVSGVPHKIFGQAIKAFVVVQKGSALNEKEVKRYCMKNLEPFMVPEYVKFLESLPKTVSGKIDKKRL